VADQMSEDEDKRPIIVRLRESLWDYKRDNARMKARIAEATRWYDIVKNKQIMISFQLTHAIRESRKVTQFVIWIAAAALLVSAIQDVIIIYILWRYR
jgi:hypothetical protein